MKAPYIWQYNEFDAVGTDYSKPEEVFKYDEFMQTMRDIPGELDFLFSATGLNETSTVIDFGCGTGLYTVPIAQRCRQVIGVDISQTMLDYTQQKAQRLNVDSIQLCRGGFLTYIHTDEPVDCIVSSLAFHHLSDFWKAIALRRLYHMLKPGGYFYLHDVVFSFNLDEYADKFTQWINDSRFAKRQEGVIRHIRDEFSVTTKILDLLFTECGYTIEHCKTDSSEMMAIYVCRRS